MSTHAHQARYVHVPNAAFSGAWQSNGHGNAPSLAAPMSERSDDYVK
jgi:hypothetical protein